MQKYANLVELEKCCQTHIFLQNFVLIQPRTSPPKICKILPILLTLFEVAEASTARDRAAAELLEARRRQAEAVQEARTRALKAQHEGRSAKFRQIVARFRLYRHRSLQENTRFAAFFKIYQIICLKILKFCNI